MMLVGGQRLSTWTILWFENVARRRSASGRRAARPPPSTDDLGTNPLGPRVDWSAWHVVCVCAAPGKLA